MAPYPIPDAKIHFFNKNMNRTIRVTTTGGKIKQHFSSQKIQFYITISGILTYIFFCVLLLQRNQCRKESYNACRGDELKMVKREVFIKKESALFWPNTNFNRLCLSHSVCRYTILKRETKKILGLSSFGGLS